MRNDPGSLDEAPISKPAPMNDGQAYRLARRLYGAAGATVRRGAELVVGVRVGQSRRFIVQGAGPTWESAFDRALASVEQ